jgi:GTP-binding protein Era
VPHKSGFVNIIGNPNVGKSTLMNALVGEKLSIITSKAQTTRHRILGIVNGDDFQLVYSDTPGIIVPHYKLQESMMKAIETALDDADVFLYVTDMADESLPQGIIDILNGSKKPIILAINKIDLSTQDAVNKKILFCQEVFPDAEIVAISALLRFNVETIFPKILEKLPESPPFFPKDELTDKTMRFFVSEIIREKIFLNYKKEVPYSTEVTIEAYEDKEKIVHITATIHVVRESQKGILLGHQGKAIKKTGTEARKDIEDFIGKKVFLELHVKLNKDWRENALQLKRFGYEL